MRWVVVLLGWVLALVTGARAEKFEFVVMGDMPYGERAPYLRLLSAVEAAGPAFAIHVGDTKRGFLPCTVAGLEEILADFQRLKVPLVYTPGDNEWVDCVGLPARVGPMGPLTALDFILEKYFPAPVALGVGRMALTRQAEAMSGLRRGDHDSGFVENARWEHGGVLFITVHVPGSNNNLRPGFDWAMAEFRARDTANRAWIAEAFRLAGADRVRGVVFAFHANLWNTPPAGVENGFAGTLATLAEGAAGLGKPVLMAQGDSHRFLTARPLRNSQGRTIRNAVRLQVMGAGQVHAVRVRVDPALPGLFRCAALLVPGNPVGADSRPRDGGDCAAGR